MTLIFGSRARRDGRRLVVWLVAAGVGLLLGAAALKRGGSESGAGMAGVAAFLVLVWAGLAALTAGARRRADEARAWRETSPSEPWRWKAEWRAGGIKGGTTGEALALGLFATVFLGLSAPGVWQIPSEIKRGNHAILLVLLFWVVGFWLLWLAWRRVRQTMRLGTLVFHPEPLPGSWGGFVGGVIHIPRGAAMTGDVKLRLRNVRLTETGSGKSRQIRESILWETDALLDDEKLGQRNRVRDVPVLFHVPRGEGLPSDENDPKNRVVWRLQIDAPLAGGGELSTGFDIPVFDCGETLAAGPENAPLLDSEVARRAEDYLAEAGVIETREADARVWRLDQPGVRSSAVGVGLVLLTLVAVGYLIPVWPVRIGVGFFAVLLLAVLPGMIWRRSELRLTEHEVQVVRGSWRGRVVQRVARKDVGDLSLRESMSSAGNHYSRLMLVGVPGVDPETPHPHEHFVARKARFRHRQRAGEADTKRVLDETPRFEIEVAGHLLGPRPAERVRERLLAAIKGTR